MRWLISFFGFEWLFLPLFVAPWAIGTLVGIVCAANWNRSTLLGAVAGGTLVALLWPGMSIIFMLGDPEFWGGMCILGVLIGLGICASAITGAIVGIIRDGFSIHTRG